MLSVAFEHVINSP